MPEVICIYEWAEFNSADSLRIKRRCQLVVKLKANKYYQELLCYLFFYINFLNIKLFARISSLCVSATDNLPTPGLILIVLLAILFWLLILSLIVLLWPYHLIALLWSYCSSRIVDCIALILLLWPFCLSHCFDRIAPAVLLIALLWLYRSDRIIDGIV